MLSSALAYNETASNEMLSSNQLHFYSCTGNVLLLFSFTLLTHLSQLFEQFNPIHGHIP